MCFNCHSYQQLSFSPVYSSVFLVYMLSSRLYFAEVPTSWSIYSPCICYFFNFIIFVRVIISIYIPNIFENNFIFKDLSFFPQRKTSRFTPIQTLTVLLYICICMCLLLTLSVLESGRDNVFNFQLTDSDSRFRSLSDFIMNLFSV
jgi:hypothetical protein